MSVRKRTWTTASGEAREAWIADYADQNGKRHIKTFERKKDADKWSARTATEVQEGTHVADRDTITVAEAGELWLKDGREAGLERATVDQYERELRCHIVPLIGNVRLSRLTGPVVRNFQSRLSTEPHGPVLVRNRPKMVKCSPTMVRRVLVSLGAIVASAQEWGLINRNPVQELKSRRGKRGQSAKVRHEDQPVEIGVDCPTREEVRGILEAAQNTIPLHDPRKRWHPLFVTAAFSGLRASELRGLEWSAVEFTSAGALIHVKQRADKYNKLGAPKSKQSRRTIPVGPYVAKVLKEWKVRCPRKDGELHFVFPNGQGNVEELNNIARRGLNPAQKRAGVMVDDAPKYSMHSFRHYFASWCAAPERDGGRGMSVVQVSKLLGHSDPTLTARRYVKFWPVKNDAGELAAAERAFFA